MSLTIGAEQGAQKVQILVSLMCNFNQKSGTSILRALPPPFSMKQGYLKALNKVKIEATAYHHWLQGDGYINSICFKNWTLVFDGCCLAEESIALW